jgi:hypothetical protein
MMKPIRIIGTALLVSLTALSIAATPMPAAAGKKACPPGQRKKWTRGHALPRDVYYRPVTNWNDYNLSPPPYGHVYGDVDGDILLIREATRLVVRAILY